MAAVGSDFSSLVPFNQPEHFHDCDICDSHCSIPDSAWGPHNMSVIEHCRLEGLSDLDQDNPYVRATLLDWIDGLVHNYSIDGLRIDTAPEVKPAFWQEWQQRAGVYAFGEVFDSDVQYVAQYQGPLDATLSYPLFFAMRDVFASSQSMRKLWDLFTTYDTYFKDPTVLGTFIDNHDNARFGNLTTDSAVYKNAITYTLTTRGVPIIYYGTEQGFHGATDPYDREPLWTTGYGTDTAYFRLIAALNNWRNRGGWNGGEQLMLNVTNNVLVYARGNTTLCAVTNVGESGPTISVPVSGLSWWADGQQLVSAFDSTDVLVVKDGRVTVTLMNGLPKVYSIFPLQSSSSSSSSSFSSSSSSGAGVLVGSDFEPNAAARSVVGIDTSVLVSVLLWCAGVAVL